MNFSLFIIAVFIASYAFNSAISKKLLRIDFKKAIIYFLTVAAVGVSGEIIVGISYNHLFHRHLWDYLVHPLHGGYTSELAPMIWGSYGFYLYLAHIAFVKNKINQKWLPWFFAAETIALEVLVNLSHKIVFGKYLFYYKPSDLAHFSSVQGFLFYALTGLVIYEIIGVLIPSERIRSKSLRQVFDGIHERRFF